MSDVEEQRTSAEDSAAEPPAPSVSGDEEVEVEIQAPPPGPRLLRPLQSGSISLGVGPDGTASETAAELHARLCEVELSEFEGPLDLLLHLVRRHELDILDIPISFVCEKYLEYIEFMRTLELEVAGDYLVMAATLAYLKSRELVPRQEEEVEAGIEEEGPDPRAQLIERLLEYQKFRDAARKLDERPMAGRDTFARGQAVELPPVDAGLAPITLFRLAEAYQRVLERARIHKSHEVVMETISVAARMQQLTGILLKRSPLDFEKLFLEKTWSSEDELRSMLVVTLMSVLELVRMGIASVHQAAGAESIVIQRVASEAEAKEALAEYDEAVSYGKASKKAKEDDEPGEDEPEVDDAEALGLLDDDDSGEDEPEADDGEALGLLDDDGDEPEPETHDGEVLGLLDYDGEPEADEPEAPGLPDDEPAAAEQEVAAQPQDMTESSRAVERPRVPDGTGSPLQEGPSPSDAGVFVRSVVSDSPPFDAVSRGEDAQPPDSSEDDDAQGSTEGDGEEHRENGEAQEVEGS